MDEPRKRWSLGSSRELLGDVRHRTERAVSAVEELEGRLATAAEGTPESETLSQRIDGVLGDWVRAMEALGLDVKGLWLVDFDNGSGYYCWRWPEERLEYFHTYEDGFADRVRIQ